MPPSRCEKQTRESQVLTQRRRHSPLCNSDQTMVLLPTSSLQLLPGRNGTGRYRPNTGRTNTQRADRTNILDRNSKRSRHNLQTTGYVLLPLTCCPTFSALSPIARIISSPELTTTTVHQHKRVCYSSGLRRSLPFMFPYRSLSNLEQSF